jgi:hypothetical protein
MKNAGDNQEYRGISRILGTPAGPSLHIAVSTVFTMLHFEHAFPTHPTHIHELDFLFSISRNCRKRLTIFSYVEKNVRRFLLRGEKRTTFSLYWRKWLTIFSQLEKTYDVFSQLEKLQWQFLH